MNPRPSEDRLIHLGTDLTTGEAVYQSIFERARMAAMFGQTGSGKSLAMRYQFGQIIQSGHGALLLDGHRLSAESVLDDVIYDADPEVLTRVWYLSSQHPESTLMLELLERHAQTPLQHIAERDRIAKDFSQILTRTANLGGSDALQGMVRLMNNLTLGCYALYDANLPIAFLPLLFAGQSQLLDMVLARTRDDTVIRHFTKIASFRPEEREKYTESVMNRLHQLYSSLALRTLFSQFGDVTVSRILAEDRIVITDLGPAEGNAPEHARLLQSILINAYFRAAQRRSADEAQAHPCHLVLEEAATVTGPAEIEMLAQARKFGFWADPLVFQGFEGLQRSDYDLVAGVLNNTGTKMVFRMGNDRDARRLAEILYAAEADPRRVLAWRERRSQRVVGHQQVDTVTRNTGESSPDFGSKKTRSQGEARGSTFLPQYAEHIDREPVYMATGDQFLEWTAGLLNLQPGQFVLQSPSCSKPRLCYSPLVEDPYRFMPEVREQRRTSFLNQLFTRWPYRDTHAVLRSFAELAATFGIIVHDGAESETTRAQQELPSDDQDEDRSQEESPLL